MVRWLGPDSLVHATDVFPTRKERIPVHVLGSYTAEYIEGQPTDLQRQTCCRKFEVTGIPPHGTGALWDYKRPVNCMGCLAEVG